MICMTHAEIPFLAKFPSDLIYISYPSSLEKKGEGINKMELLQLFSALNGER